MAQLGLQIFSMVLVGATMALTCALLVAVECAPTGGQQSSNQASARLMKDLQEVYKSDSYKRGVFEIELAGDNIYEWDVKLKIMDDKLPLHQDLKQLKAEGKGEDHIMLRISFGQDYPVAPPFVRVVSPVLHGGWMQRAGAICMDLITKSGWNSDYTSEALILAVAQHIVEGGSRVNVAPAVITIPEQQYTDKNARDRFKEIVQIHDWDGQQQQQKQQKQQKQQPQPQPQRVKKHSIEHKIVIDIGKMLKNIFG